MSEYGSSRFGWDSKSRVTGTAVVLQEQSLTLPGEPSYAPIPFLPTLTGASNAIGGTTDDGQPIWQSFPSRCDLTFYQGDDVVIPLFFNDPDQTGDDLDTNYAWLAQIRQRHSYQSTLVANLSINVEYHPSPTGTDEPDVDDEYTKVEMYLPRKLNTSWGVFEWEIYSLQTVDMSRFPAPPDWPEGTTWPTADVVKTWLYGRCNIVPRTTTTDMLPAQPGVTTLGSNGMVISPWGAIGGSGFVPSVGIDAYGRVDPVPVMDP
jgi:hypothetical protein